MSSPLLFSVVNDCFDVKQKGQCCYLISLVSLGGLEGMICQGYSYLRRVLKGAQSEWQGSVHPGTDLTCDALPVS